jgi:hypothetical protein
MKQWSKPCALHNEFGCTCERGPIYNIGSATLAKMRRVQNPTWEQRQAHGEAVEQAVLAAQWSALQRELPSFRPNCASGTWHNNADGKVGEAIRAKHQKDWRGPWLLRVE